VKVKHIVLWKLKDDIDKDEIFALLKREYAAFIPEVPGVVSWDMSRGFAGYDVCLEVVFESREALEGYDVHPAHAQYKKIPAQYRTDRVSTDIWVE